MRPLVLNLMRLATIALFLALLVMAARGQSNSNINVQTAGRLQINELDRLAAKAAEVVNVNLDERLLKIIPAVLSKEKPDEAKAKEILSGLKGVYVKVLEFDTDGAYNRESDVASIRQQLRAPGWSRIVEVHSRREGQDIEVYLLTNGSSFDGLAVLAFEPKQLVVVNIVGSVDLEKLIELKGKFGLPELEIEQGTKSEKK